MLKYEKEIIEALLEKYQKRIIHEEGKNEVNREISVKPRNVYSKYGVNYDCDLLFNNAVDNLANKGFASAQKKEFSDDIEKIVLQKKNADQLIKYAFDTYDIIPINNHISNENELIKQYIEKGELTKFYCENTIVPKIQKSYKAFDVEEDQKVLKLLDFIQHNQKKLYIREVSMLVFGSSKVFESQYYQKEYGSHRS